MQWTLLLALSTLLVGAAEGLRLPAALLLGPMIAAIIVGASEATVRVAPRPFIAAQAVVGCMIGQSIPLTVLTDPGLDADADRHLRRHRGAAGRPRRHRPAHGLSRHQPGRRRFDCHHRGLEQRRHALRHGHADGTAAGCAADHP
jgi:hypothetical protein